MSLQLTLPSLSSLFLVQSPFISRVFLISYLVFYFGKQTLIIEALGRNEVTKLQLSHRKKTKKQTGPTKREQCQIKARNRQFVITPGNNKIEVSKITARRALHFGHEVLQNKQKHSY